MRHTIFFSLVVIFAGILITSCAKHDPAAGDVQHAFTIPDSLLSNITYDTLRYQPVTSELSLSGKLTFNEDHVVKILPLVSGHVSDVRVSLGDYVEKGKVLAVVRSSDMANYFNEFKSSQSELGIAKKSLEVANSMHASGVTSERDLLVAESDYQKALAQYNKIHEVLQIYGSAFAKSDSAGSGFAIVAPINGFIVEKNVTIGMDLRRDDNNTLFTISDLKDVWAIANVFETDIAKLNIGDSAVVTTLSYPNQHFNGTVERISNIVDPESKVMNVKIHLANPAYALKPGMFAHIGIRFTDDKHMLAVHSNTIIFDDNKQYVLRYRSQTDVTMQRVNVYKSLNDISYVESDSLQEGDNVIAKNGLFVFTALRKQ